MIAALAGAVIGAGILAAMLREKLFVHRDAAAVLLVAIAAFWPVFAADTGSVASALAQTAGLTGFLVISLWARRTGMIWLGAAIAAHGAFDLAIWPAGPPGPDWWAPFCAGVDIVIGAGLVALVLTRKVPQ